ncbi:MAG: hypothetical protein R3E75_04970 [Steroidobacteraceae bacterium]
MNPLAPIGHALITGASSSIGTAIAREYARRGIPPDSRLGARIGWTHWLPSWPGKCR